MGLTRDLGAVLVTLLIGPLVYILNGLSIRMIQWNQQLLSKSYKAQLLLGIIIYHRPAPFLAAEANGKNGTWTQEEKYQSAAPPPVIFYNSLLFGFVIELKHTKRFRKNWLKV